MICEVLLLKLKDIAKLLDCVQEGGEFIVFSYNIGNVLISYEQRGQIK